MGDRCDPRRSAYARRMASKPSSAFASVAARVLSVAGSDAWSESGRCARRASVELDVASLGRESDSGDPEPDPEPEPEPDPDPDSGDMADWDDCGDMTFCIAECVAPKPVGRRL